MSLKYIPTGWRDDLRTNFAHDTQFYINPRGRQIPALTSAGISYILNDKTTNMRGTYRMQCGASTDLTYLYTLPQRFIIEGWFKPEFAFDVATAQYIFRDTSTAIMAQLYYSAVNDRFEFATRVGGTFNSIVTTAFSSSTGLQKWIYVRCFFDNVSKLKGFFCTVNGVVYADSQNIPGAGTFPPGNVISFFQTVATESSYWIIHELDEALPTGEYKTYNATRQIIFGFNGTTLARERLKITGYTKSFNMLKQVEDPISGSAGANTAGLVLHNTLGQFSDDQYDAYDPFQGYFNGTEKYLQNRAQIEIESNSPSSTIRNGILQHYSFDDSSTVTALDNSGNGNDGTITGATPCDGISGKALSFDGINDKVDIPMSASHNADFSVSMWINVPSSYTWDTAGRRQIFGGNYNSVAGSIAIVKHSEDNKIYCGIRALVGGVDFTVNTGVVSITRDTWYHVVLVYRGSSDKKIAMYVDAVKNPTESDAFTGSGTFGNQYLAYLAYGGTPTSSYDEVKIDEFRIYNLAVTESRISILYNTPSDWGVLSLREPLYIGRTTPGAFTRSSPNKFYGDVTVNTEDGVAELGEAILAKAATFDSFDLSDPANEADSLVHAIARLVTKKEIKNYCHNSSGENATLANSWINDSLTNCERSTDYVQFGTYSTLCIAGSAGNNMSQIVTFEGIDKIDVGDIFNLSAYIYQGTASTMSIRLDELTTAGALIASSTTACGADSGLFTKVDVSRTIVSPLCTQLRIVFIAVGAGTFYIDGVMLVRGIDPLDYFLINATDGASGICNADNAATTTFDTVAINAEAVDIEHPFVAIEKGGSPWEALKSLGEATLASYIGMSPDGVLEYRVRYNELDEDNLGEVEDGASVATSLGTSAANSIAVYGAQVVEETSDTALYIGSDSGQWDNTTGGGMFHAIADSALATIAGASTIELVYDDTVKGK